MHFNSSVPFNLPIFIVCILGGIGAAVLTHDDDSQQLTVIEVERALQEIPLFNWINENEPEASAQIVEEMRRLDQSNSLQAIAKVRDVTIGLLGKYSPYTSDASVIRFIEVTLETAKQLSAHSPELCYQFFFPGQSVFDLTEYVDSKTLKEILEVEYDFLSSATLNPQEPPDSIKADELLDQLFAELGNQYSEDDFMAVVEPYAPGVDKQKACDITVAMYNEILAMPNEQESGLLLRSMLSAVEQPGKQ